MAHFFQSDDPRDNDKGLRKKLQNRANQRARRVRLKKEHPEKTKTRNKPYEVGCCRVDELDDFAVSRMVANKTRTKQQSQLCGPSQMATRHSLENGKPQEVEEIPLLKNLNPFADQLLHLVQQNVWRAFGYNKDLLELSAAHFRSEQNGLIVLTDTAKCSGAVTILPIGLDMPDSLMPTQIQMSVPHAPWINLLPFPQMRDKLILFEGSFDHADFLGDLIGQTIEFERFDRPTVPEGCVIPTTFELQRVDEDISTPGSKGLVTCGEPYREQNWEATPGFLRKWMWAVEGCEALIETTNRWRESRGEEPLQLFSKVEICGQKLTQSST